MGEVCDLGCGVGAGGGGVAIAGGGVLGGLVEGVEVVCHL